MKKMRRTSLKSRHLATRAVLMVLALVVLVPIVVTFLYSFFSPTEIKAYMGTRGSYDDAAWMDVKLSPNMFSLNQYYEILIRDTSILRMFVLHRRDPARPGGGHSDDGLCAQPL